MLTHPTTDRLRELGLAGMARALEERVPALGLDGVEDAIPAGVKAASEQVALRVRQVATGGPLASADLRPGDLLIELKVTKRTKPNQTHSI